MSSAAEYGRLATAYAGLQHSLLSIEGGIAPHATLPPSASGSPSATQGSSVADEGLALKLPPQSGSPSTTRVPHEVPPNPQSPIPRLIAASKSQPIPMLEAAIALGIRDFGENRVQEAAEKWPALKARHPDLRLHLIGPLQSNKAAEAVALFDVIQTVDRPKIADALAREIERARRSFEARVASHGEPQASAQRGGATRGRDAPLRTKFATPQLLIQVNIGEEPQKSGIAPKELPALLAHCRTLGLEISGLMAVPPADANPAPYFALMNKLAQAHGLHELSMGMSGDYEVGLRFGATMIRVGTALFGERR